MPALRDLKSQIANLRSVRHSTLAERFRAKRGYIGPPRDPQAGGHGCYESTRIVSSNKRSEDRGAKNSCNGGGGIPAAVCPLLCRASYRRPLRMAARPAAIGAESTHRIRDPDRRSSASALADVCCLGDFHFQGRPAAVSGERSRLRHRPDRYPPGENPPPLTRQARRSRPVAGVFQNLGRSLSADLFRRVEYRGRRVRLRNNARRGVRAPIAIFEREGCEPRRHSGVAAPRLLAAVGWDGFAFPVRQRGGDAGGDPGRAGRSKVSEPDFGEGRGEVGARRALSDESEGDRKIRGQRVGQRQRPALGRK